MVDYEFLGIEIFGLYVVLVLLLNNNIFIWYNNIKLNILKKWNLFCVNFEEKKCIFKILKLENWYK